MSPLNPKAVRLINEANKKLKAKNIHAPMSSEGEKGLAGFLSLLVEIQNNDTDDQDASTYEVKKRASRHATKAVIKPQPVSGVGIKDILCFIAFLILYIAANSIAPVLSTEQGTVDPLVSYSRF